MSEIKNMTIDELRAEIVARSKNVNNNKFSTDYSIMLRLYDELKRRENETA